jgi:DNA adenine methylase
VLHADFQSTIEQTVRAGDLVYLDPPFAVSNRRLFHQYGPDTFGLNDLERLRTALHLIDSRGATFVLSYADSPEARRYLADWRSKRLFVQRNVAGFGAHRRRSVELIVSNIRDWPGI